MDDKLKQRLIGALVLIIAAVVFLPMLLSGQDETVRVEVEVPEAPVMDESEIRAAAPIELPQPEPVPGIPGSDETPVPETPQVPVETVSAPEPPQPEVAAPAIVQGNWVVQLGSFSSAANAESLRDTLVSQGYNAYTLSARVDGSDITRVFVGPLIDRAGAGKLRDELAKRHGMQGLVTAYDVGTGKR
ncbi:SPOR domain-containing protein [uncultured Halopseudomonas sp.]|uniref:SPOR domain-containing protein n=1 Tax=uncultured Halopseudomonas sp. TaxID=2901193 RepID=UPI0030EE2223|tara:strand:+ start:13447 stop:14010 length:564 start_codon:yes stop_codon:yes gene_type:complete